MTVRRPSAPRRPRPNRYRRSATEKGRLLRRGLQVFSLFLLVTGLPISFVLLHDIATQCRCLAARHIEVIGNRQLHERAVIRQAGIDPETNLLAVRLIPCRTRLMAHPWIQDASVRRQFPDRIQIHVTEHEALALVEMADGRYLINAAGRPFKRWGNGDPEHLPAITGLAYADLPALEPPKTPLLARALEALTCWRRSHLDGQTNRQAVRIVVDRESGLSIETGSSLGVLVLGQGQYPEKFVKLSRFIEAIATRESTGWKWIDLTHPQRIVARPDSGSKEV